jgi:CoA-transferase family III
MHTRAAVVSVMNDYIAGYLGAAGIQAALIRRAEDGGSYHVRVSLARCAMWFMSLGKFDQKARAPTGEQHQLLAPDTITAQTPYGELLRLAPPVKFSETEPYWEKPKREYRIATRVRSVASCVERAVDRCWVDVAGTVQLRQTAP